MHILLRPASVAMAALLWGSGLMAQVPADSTARRQQRTLDSLIVVIRGLQSRIDSLAQKRASGDTTGGDELASLRAAASAASADSAGAANQPRQARLGQNALNPEISVTGDLRVGASNPRAAGSDGDNFIAREFEVGFQSALDPFATAKIFASFEGGQASIEEGYIFFPVLPGHVRLDVGRFRQEVGELNRWHLHAVPEDEYPLVIRRYGSDDGMVGTGVSLYWPMPISGKLGTYELTVQGTSGDNPVLYAGGNRPAINSKLAGFWQLTRSTYLMASASGAYGTNPNDTLGPLTTSLAVLAARLTWRPPQQGQAKELTVRGEYWSLHRDIGGTATTRYGGYVDATWKLDRRYTLSTRWDWLQAVDPAVASHEWAITPTLTYWQSEFVFLRALYEHASLIDPGQIAARVRDRLAIQVVFAMGPHKHELF